MDLYQVARSDSETTIEQDIDRTMRRLLEAMRDSSHDGPNSGDHLHALANALAVVHDLRCTVTEPDNEYSPDAQVSITIPNKR